MLKNHTFLPKISCVCSFTGIYPFIIYVYWFRKEINGRLKIFKTFGTLNSSRVPLLVHIHLTWFWVIAKWTIKYYIKCSCVLFWWSLSLRFSSSHVRVFSFENLRKKKFSNDRHCFLFLIFLSSSSQSYALSRLM